MLEISTWPQDESKYLGSRRGTRTHPRSVDQWLAPQGAGLYAQVGHPMTSWYIPPKSKMIVFFGKSWYNWTHLALLLKATIRIKIRQWRNKRDSWLILTWNHVLLLVIVVVEYYCNTDEHILTTSMPIADEHNWPLSWSHILSILSTVH